MKTAQEIERLNFEFWTPLNESLEEDEKRCPRIRDFDNSSENELDQYIALNCDLYNERTDGSRYLICHLYPNACKLNPFQVNREWEKLK